MHSLLQAPESTWFVFSVYGVSSGLPNRGIQGQFKDTDYTVALIVFIHTHGRNGSYNPHLHIILVGVFQITSSMLARL